MAAALTETQEAVLHVLRRAKESGHYGMHVDEISRHRGASKPTKARLGTNSALCALERRGLVGRFPSRRDQWATNAWFVVITTGSN